MRLRLRNDGGGGGGGEGEGEGRDGCGGFACASYRALELRLDIALAEVFHVCMYP